MKTEGKKMHIVTAADNKYIAVMTTMLCSLLENKQPDVSICVYVLDGGIEEGNKEKLSRFLNKYGVKPDYFKVNPDVYGNFKISGHVSVATYFRIFIPKLISNDVKKVLYLDADMVVLADLFDLWSTEFNQPLAAVQNNFEPHIKTLGLVRQADYFNAGLMLINLPVWRQLKVTENVLSYIERFPERLKYWDQDALNAVIGGNWHHFSSAYNYSYSSVPELSWKEIKVIHFIGPNKPFLYYVKHPFRKWYYRYLRKTPWKFSIPPDLNYTNIRKNFFGKIYRLFYPKKPKATEIKDHVRIVSAADNAYALPLGVMLLSIMDTRSLSTSIEVHIIDVGLSLKNKRRLNFLARRKSFFLTFHTVNAKRYQDFVVHGYFSRAIYYRFSIPDLFDNNVEKALYLDCDIIVRKDLADLWNMDISRYYLAAVPNPFPESYKKVMVLQRPDFYFNSGVLLMNLKKWRQDKITERLINFVSGQTMIVFPDQDALNAVIGSDYLPLLPTFNQQEGFRAVTWDQTTFSEEDFIAALSDPHIVHFSGPQKPWMYNFHNPEYRRFFRYKSQSPWRFDFSIKNIYMRRKYFFLNEHKQLFALLRRCKGVLRSLGLINRQQKHAKN